MVLSTNHTRGAVPDYEDAVYHPAVTALKWTAAALVALLASPAFAYHDTLGGGASIAGGAFLSAFIVATWRTFWENRGLQCQGKS